MMNREQRRAYASKIKGDKRASKCPLCGYTSLFYSAPVLKPYEGVKEKFVAEDFDVVIKCDVCGGTVLANDAITKLIKPGVYCPFLWIFLKWHLNMKTTIQKRRKANELVFNENT